MCNGVQRQASPRRTGAKDMREGPSKRDLRTRRRGQQATASHQCQRDQERQGRPTPPPDVEALPFADRPSCKSGNSAHAHALQDAFGDAQGAQLNRKQAQNGMQQAAMQ
ncbi:hypothetical protein ACJBU6_05806 [Exserohilum turcicum]